MKVRDLIEALASEDPEREVIMASDAEGNGYSPLSSLYAGMYLPESTWAGEVLDDEEEGDSRAIPAIVLCSIN